MKLSELFIDESKWVKGKNCARRLPDGTTIPAYVGGDCWCLLGGVNLIAPEKNDNFKLREKIRMAIKKLFPGHWVDDKFDFVMVSAFNDDPGTIFADVQAVIREVESQ